MKKGFATLKEVAKASGFSINTVSRALNNKPYVNQITKDKILETAKKLNYVKNTTATSLRYSKTGIIGVIVVDTHNPFYSSVLKGIENEARKKNYQIILMNTDRNYKNEEKAIRTLLERRVDGIIMTTVQTDIKDLKMLESINFPTTLISYDNSSLSLDKVLIDDFKGGYLAANHLLEKNKKNLIMFNTFNYKYVAVEREKGFKKAITEKGLPFSNEKNIIRSKEGYENAYIKFKDYWKRHSDKIDGIFCYNDIFGLAVLQVLKEKNVKVPEEIAVVGFDNITFSNISFPTLSTININTFKIGQESFKSVYNQILNNKSKKIKIVIDVQLLERESS